MNPRLKVLNLETAKYECVFPVCGGICCKNGRPGVEPAEIARLEAELPRFFPHLRPEARQKIEREGFLSARTKDGCKTLRVSSGWCVFFNEGCVLHKVGAEEGDRFKYKPWRCVAFPLDVAPNGDWFVRQWNERGEAWDLFCLDPAESPRPASETLAAEVSFVEALTRGSEGWRKEEPSHGNARRRTVARRPGDPGKRKR